MDERELEQLFEKLRSGADLTDDEMRRLGRNTGSVSKAFEFLGKQSMDLGAKLYKGTQGAAVYNDAIKSSADALGNAAGTLIKNLGPLGKVLGLTVKSIGTYAAEVNLLSDRLFKNYQNLSKVGVSAADGMIGLGEAAQRLGLGMDEAGLENFGRLMKGAAVDLALLSGSAAQGREDFVQFAEILVRGPVGRELQNLGYSVEELNEGLADYIGLQARVGLAQNKTQAELRAGAAAYLKEMDGLTKLTGIQRAEMEEGINRARAVEAFRAKVEDLRAKGQVEEAKNMELYYSILLKQAPTLAQGYAEAASGLIVSPAGRQFFQAIQAGTGVIEGLSTGTMTLEQALGATYKQAKLSEEQFRGLAMAMAAGDVVGSYTELADIAKRSGINQEEAARIIKETQEAQAKGPGGVAAQTDLRRTQMETRDSLQNLVAKGIRPVTAAMQGLASVTKTVVTGLGGTVAGGYATEGGGGPAEPGAAAGATPGSTRAGGVVGAMRDFFTGGGGPSVANWEDYIKFGGNTGSREHFRKLQPHVQEAFAQMARDYWNLTGDKLQVNSAFRSPEEQAAIDPGGNPRAAPGMSLHNEGRAIDIQSAQARYLMDQGLLDKYGFKSGAAFNDPPHIYMRKGGIARGSESGYPATLHGTEAVVPLPDGKTIPVSMPGLNDLSADLSGTVDRQFARLSGSLAGLDDLPNNLSGTVDRQFARLGGILSDLTEASRADLRSGDAAAQLVGLPDLATNMSQQLSMMGSQLAALQTIAAAMRDQNSISTKILQVANN